MRFSSLPSSTVLGLSKYSPVSIISELDRENPPSLTLTSRVIPWMVQIWMTLQSGSSAFRQMARSGHLAFMLMVLN